MRMLLDNVWKIFNIGPGSYESSMDVVDDNDIIWIWVNHLLSDFVQVMFSTHRFLIWIMGMILIAPLSLSIK